VENKTMQKTLLIKAVLVAGIFSILLVPLSMIGGIVAERAARQQAVVQDISASSFGKQIFAGLTLSLPYAEEYAEEVAEGRERRIEKRRIDRTLRLFPTTSEVIGTATVGEKHRGLFKVRTFNWQANVRGDFVLDGKVKVERTRGDSRIVWGQPVISLGLSDPRGLVGAPALEWAGQRIAFERGSGVPGIASGLHALATPIDPTQPQRLPYSLAISLQGTQSLGIVPLADNNRVSLKSDWPHPSFGAQFLPQPESQQTGKEGFAAQWTVTALASNAQQQVQALFKGRKEGLESIERLEVGFIEPIDIYSLSDRALKYGFLFIGLTFGCFFLFEVLKRLPIHPAQYGLVGLALATFFLLLIALSEHIAFWIAYVIAAAACIALLGFYLSAALRGVNRGVSFSIMLTAVYSALYGLLVSEDNALLLGSILVFALVAAAMVLTRKVNWYGVGTNEPELPGRLSGAD
jgi:inner membrane protein